MSYPSAFLSAKLPARFYVQVFHVTPLMGHFGRVDEDTHIGGSPSSFSVECFQGVFTT